MIIDPEVKKQLDLRLASGEICEEEYAKLLTKITEATSNKTNEKQSLKNSIWQHIVSKHDSIFGSNKFKVPSNNDPLHVTKDLIIYGTFIVFEQEKIHLKNIHSLTYDYSSITVNLLPVNKTIYLTINLIDGRTISINSSSMIRTKTGKLIQNAYAYLTKATFKTRMQHYINEINQKGFFECDNAKIYFDGTIEKDNLKLNLKIAKKSGVIGLGTQCGWSDRTINRKAILVSETNDGFFAKKIIIDPVVNTDVVHALIGYIAIME